jgi:hypothetical protein
MYNIADSNPGQLPSSASLIKATAIALVVGTVVLVTAILPAEYGVDPTGLGEKMGLTALHSPQDEASPPATGNLLGAQLSSVWKSVTPARTDTLELTLQPDEGAEIKALMKAGEQFVFTWDVQGGQVNFDMHGEPPNAGDEFSSYWKGRNQSSAHGAFVAPFDGTHGWYWRNRGTEPVTVRVTTTGFYESLNKP